MNSKRFFVGMACVLAGCGAAPDDLGHTVPSPAPSVPAPLPITPPPGEPVVTPVEEPLQVTLDGLTPPAGAVAGGTGKMFAVFRIANPNKHPVSVGSFTLAAVGQHATPKDFTGVEYRWSLPPSPKATEPLGSDGRVTFKPEKGEITLAAQGTGQIFVAGRMAEIVPSSISGDLPRSGHTPGLAMVSLRSASGLEANFEKPLRGPGHVLRRSFPKVTPVAMAPEGLAEGPIELYRFDLKTEAAAVGLKQFAFEISVSGAKLCNFRIHRGGKVSPGFYALGVPSDPKASPVNLKSGCLSEGNGQKVVAGFSNEETVPWNILDTFALFAAAENVTAGAWTLTNFVQTQLVTTDVLTCSSGGFVSFGGGPSALPAILWSDLSEDPHTSSCQSSKDWIGDGGLADFTLAQARKQ